MQNFRGKFVVKCRSVIMHEGKLLVVRHAGNTAFAALPGGHLELGEDIRECAEREILEELGVKPVLGRLLYINNYVGGNEFQSIEFFFEVLNGEDYLEPEKLPRSHAHEIDEILWLSPKDEVKVMPEKFAEDFRSGRVLSNEVRYIN